MYFLQNILGIIEKKLLAYSFAHVDDNYYVRELEILIDEDPGNLSRELKKLEIEGLFCDLFAASLFN